MNNNTRIDRYGMPYLTEADAGLERRTKEIDLSNIGIKTVDSMDDEARRVLAKESRSCVQVMADFQAVSIASLVLSVVIYSVEIYYLVKRIEYEKVPWKNTGIEFPVPKGENREDVGDNL